MRKGHVFPYSHFIVPYRQNVTVAIFMFLEVAAFLGNRFSSKTSEWASGRITMRIRVENGISKVASLTGKNSQSLIPVTVNDRNSHIRNGHMTVTYLTVSNGQKVDNIFLRPVFDADSRGDLRFRSFCRH